MTDLTDLPGPGSVLSISHILTHFTDEVTGTEKGLGHLCVQIKVLTLYKSCWSGEWGPEAEPGCKTLHVLGV